MAIGVVVRNEQGENLSDYLEFVPLIGWAHRSEFPMLTHQDPYGNMVLNRLQIETLLGELNALEAEIGQVGMLGVLERVNSPLLSQRDVPIEEMTRTVTEYIGELRILGATTLEKVHRFLWFVGD